MTDTAPRHGGFLIATWLVAAIAQFLIATNPGYLSHDELQWAVRADVATLRDLPWVAWFDLQVFQWRPLTFNLWLPLSWALFDHPVAFHLLWVVLGSGLAVALAALLLRLELAPRPDLPCGCDWDCDSGWDCVRLVRQDSNSEWNFV